jgi:hypothetical protein
MVAKPIERIDRRKDGSIGAIGCIINGVPTGYWEWFRKDGTKMRSRYFENGKQPNNGRPMTPGESRQSHEDEVSPLSSRCPPPKAKAPPGDGAGLSLQ